MAAAGWCAAVLALAACGQPADGESAATATASPTASASASSPATTSDSRAPGTEAVAKGTTITTGASEFGTMLLDSRQQAIYLFGKERTSTAECYGDCAEAWPPVLTDATPVASGSAIQALLGTTKRTDGATQVTYGGHPLYFYAHEAPGEVKCHDVRGFGGLWLVVGPDGNRRP